MKYLILIIPLLISCTTVSNDQYCKTQPDYNACIQKIKDHQDQMMRCCHDTNSLGIHQGCGRR